MEQIFATFLSEYKPAGAAAGSLPNVNPDETINISGKIWVPRTIKNTQEALERKMIILVQGWVGNG